MPFAQDLGYALRRFRQRPAFLLAALLTLTVGIGANAVIFSLVNFLLLRPLPVDRPEEVVSLDFGWPVVSFPNYLDIRDRNEAFSHVAALRVMPMQLSLDRGKARLWGYLVSGNYFELLGISAWRGRLLSSSDDLKTGAHAVAVLSHGAWQRRFGADPDVVGSTVRVNGHPFTIVGVAPPGFIGTERFFASEIWVPFSMIREIEGRDWREARVTANAWAIARLRPGVSREQAEVSLAVLARQLALEHPEVNEGLRIRLAPPGLLGNMLRGPVVGVSAALLLVSGLTLLLACTNLSSLILAQAADRRREFAVRLSIGASRSPLARMVVAENLLLAAGGGALGLLSSVWLGDALSALLPAVEFPVNAEIPMDWRVVAFAAALAFMSALFSSVLPALRASAVDPAPALKNEASLDRLRRFHLRDVYVAVQVALSVVLLSGSLMMVRTLQRTLTLRFGFEPDGAVALRFDLGMQGYTEERGREFQRVLLERVATLPGIEAAGLANSIPFSIDQSYSHVYVEGKPEPPVSQAPSAVYYQATPDFFRALGTRILRGRDFNDRDTAEASPVVIVNRTLADKLLPGEDALGKRLRFGLHGRLVEIVGLVEEGKYQTLTEAPQLAVWVPLAQSYNTPSTLVARTRLREEEALALLERTVAEMDPDLPVFDAKPLRGYLDMPLTPLRVTTASLTAMGTVAVFLSALGLYGLLAYSTSRRVREIGIRMALGARPLDVLRVVLMRTLLLVSASAAIGLALSFFTTRLLGGLLYAVPDAWVYVLALSIITAVSTLACLAPARRAVYIQPLSALRYE